METSSNNGPDGAGGTYVFLNGCLHQNGFPNPEKWVNSMVFLIIFPQLLRCFVESVCNWPHQGLGNNAMNEFGVSVGRPPFAVEKLIQLYPFNVLHIAICVSWFQFDMLQQRIATHVKDFFKLPSEPKFNEWFTGNYEGANIDIIIVDEAGRNSNVHYTSKNGDNFQDKNRSFFFHGTKDTSALDIIFSGIKPEGGAKKDFSHYDGFYLNNNFNEALNWPRHVQDRAVLIFECTRETLSDFHGLDLREDNERWQKVMNYFRSGKESVISPGTLEMLEDGGINFIEGPMAYKKDNSWVQKRNSYQLCVKSDDLAEVFDSSLHSIVFLVNE